VDLKRGEVRHFHSSALTHAKRALSRSRGGWTLRRRGRGEILVVVTLMAVMALVAVVAVLA